MEKKGTWFSAVKRFFTCSCKPVNEGDKKRLKHGPSFIPSFREPSSIEEILGDIDHQHNLFNQPHQPQQQPPPPSSSSPPTITTSPLKIEQTPEEPHLPATRIQAAYRGYMARRHVTGLVRLQRVLTSQNARRQTVNAMKQMQLLVRVQTQIQSRRIQMLESQAHKPQPSNNNSHPQSEMGDEYWDDSLITKEEKEARLKRKEDAAIRREKAMAYAYSHQLRKDTPPPAHQTAQIPWWWKWLEPKLPYHVTPTHKNRQFAATPSRSTQTRTHKQLDSPTSSNRSVNYSRARKAASLYSNKDDDSLMSCPPFSVPNYMSPTASARAKARPTSNPKERRAAPSTPGSQSSTRRFSFPFTPNTKSPGSIGHLSMDSSVERKPFNRFV